MESPSAVDAQKGGGGGGDGLGGGLGGQRTSPPQIAQPLHLQNCAHGTNASEEAAGSKRRQGWLAGACARTVQCWACSRSALHQLLHCSMMLSCGFAGLQLTAAGLAEALCSRACAPMRSASPQAARNPCDDGRTRALVGRLQPVEGRRRRRAASAERRPGIAHLANDGRGRGAGRAVSSQLSQVN